MGAGELNVQEVIEEMGNSEYVLQHGPVTSGMVVVLYQEQLRKIGTQHWSKWTNCSEASYHRIKEEPLRNGWEWRSRKLFVEITEDYK